MTTRGTQQARTIQNHYFRQLRTLKGLKDSITLEEERKSKNANFKSSIPLKPVVAAAPPPVVKTILLDTVRWYQKGKYIAPILFLTGFTFMRYSRRLANERETDYFQLTNQLDELWQKLEQTKAENAILSQQIKEKQSN